MSIYHCSIKIIGRNDGKSAVASATYWSGGKLYDDRTGLTHDFTQKRGVVFTEVSLPAHAPPEYADHAWHQTIRDLPCSMGMDIHCRNRS